MRYRVSQRGAGSLQQLARQTEHGPDDDNDDAMVVSLDWLVRLYFS